MLENCIFIPIDIFRDRLHNEGIKDDFDAWLTFLGCDDIEYISTLIEKYPDFKPMYWKQKYIHVLLDISLLRPVMPGPL